LPGVPSIPFVRRPLKRTLGAGWPSQASNGLWDCHEVRFLRVQRSSSCQPSFLLRSPCGSALGRAGDGLDINVLAREWQMERVCPWAPCSVQRTMCTRSSSLMSEEAHCSLGAWTVPVFCTQQIKWKMLSSVQWLAPNRPSSARSNSTVGLVKPALASSLRAWLTILHVLRGAVNMVEAGFSNSAKSITCRLR
jgi:hypothetical protein